VGQRGLHAHVDPPRCELATRVFGQAQPPEPQPRDELLDLLHWQTGTQLGVVLAVPHTQAPMLQPPSPRSHAGRHDGDVSWPTETQC